MAIAAKDGDRINFDKKTITRNGQTSSIKDYKSKGDKVFKKKKSSSKVNNTKVYIVSDSEQDKNKTFQDQKILTTKEFNNRERQINTLNNKTNNNNNIKDDTNSSVLVRDNLPIYGKKEQETDNFLDIQKARNNSSNSSNINYTNNFYDRYSSDKSNNSNSNSFINRGRMSNFNPNNLNSKQKEAIKKGFDSANENILKLKNNALEIGQEVFNKGIVSPLKGVAKYGTHVVLNPDTIPSYMKKDVSKETLKKAETFSGKSLAKDKDFQSSVLLTNAVLVPGALSSAKVAASQIQNPLSRIIATRTVGTAQLGINTAGITFAGNQAKETIKDPSNKNIANLIMASPIGVASSIGLKNQVTGTIRTGVLNAAPNKVASEKVFDNKVLSNKQNMPLTTSSKNSLNQFSKAKNIVQTSSPSPIKGTVAGAGRKGTIGLEDSGIYVTPKGKGSPHFLRVNNDQKQTFTLNPFAGIKGQSVPTVTQFKTTGVNKIPSSVTKQPGFKEVEKFYKSQAGSGKAFITKRSQIGQGELPRQKFESEQDFNLDFKLNVQRKGKNIKTNQIKKGDLITESGTTELEAVVPVEQGFIFKPKSIFGKVFGFEKTTTFKGQKVAIREAELIKSPIKSGYSSRANNPVLKQRIISSRRVKGEVAAYESSIIKGTSIKPTPYPSLGLRGFLKPSSVISNNSRTRGGIISGVPQFSKMKNIPGGGFSGGFTPNKNPITGGGFSGGFTPNKNPITGGGSSTGNTKNPEPTYNIPGGGSSLKVPGSGTNPNKFFIKMINSKSKQTGTPLYDIYIRENGRIIKANKNTLPRNEAFKRGSHIVDNTTARSFVLKKRGFGNVQDIPSSNLNRFKFRNPRTKTPLKYVEKSSYAIDSAGEKRGLSAAKYLNKFKL